LKFVWLQEVEKKKEKVELEKVSRMRRQGMKCEKGKIIDESWDIQVRDDLLKKIFENWFFGYMWTSHLRLFLFISNILH
jgi:hypothetical protein